MEFHLSNLDHLISDLRAVINDESVRRRVKARMAEFKAIGQSSEERIFEELCFCLLTANFSAEGGMKIQRAIGRGFIDLPLEKLEEKLRELGHRYPRARAKYIVEARKLLGNLKEILNSFKDVKNLREWLVKNVKGLGYKEASHFLRNVGFEDVSIIDYHILDLLERYGIISKPKSMTRKRYLEIESLLRRISDEVSVSLGELDLYLWYMETGKVLK